MNDPLDPTEFLAALRAGDSERVALALVGTGLRKEEIAIGRSRRGRRRRGVCSRRRPDR